ncbi:MAG: hypothetical protein PHO41_05785 [Eubacteriales bacterium]|nr:hypothetical protein [Eubacteriales bacterium]
MAEANNKTGCALSGTRYCDMLNMPSCDACTVRASDLEQVKQDLDALTALLPEDGISDLFDTDTCQLCRGEHKNPTSCYAMVDMGHPEPVRQKKNVIGLNVKAKVGSLVPVQIACCKACKKRLNTLEYLPTVLPIGVALITLVLMMIRPIGDALQRVFQALPLVVFVVLTVAAFIAARVITKTLRSKYDTVTVTNVTELPKLQKMQEMGWFSLNSGSKPPRPVFLNKRLRVGVCTGIPYKEEKTAPNA